MGSGGQAHIPAAPLSCRRAAPAAQPPRSSHQQAAQHAQRGVGDVDVHHRALPPLALLRPPRLLRHFVHLPRQLLHRNGGVVALRGAALVCRDNRQGSIHVLRAQPKAGKQARHAPTETEEEEEELSVVLLRRAGRGGKRLRHMLKRSRFCAAAATLPCTRSSSSWQGRRGGGGGRGGGQPAGHLPAGRCVAASGRAACAPPQGQQARRASATT